mmetsp:Transcript_149686/g.480609  ORF Transcript_149686/g.480609 Transcript_149686/m.480609 type:complete len:110 (-) Transcript_149686:55-384(-)
MDSATHLMFEELSPIKVTASIRGAASLVDEHHGFGRGLEANCASARSRNVVRLLIRRRLGHLQQSWARTFRVFRRARCTCSLVLMSARSPGHLAVHDFTLLGGVPCALA